METFKKLDLVKEYNLNKEDEPLFWLKIDILIESLSIDENNKSGNYDSAMKRNWSKFFDIPYSKKVFGYLRKHKLPFKLIRDSGIQDIKSDNFVSNIIINSIMKLVIINNEETLTIQKLREKTIAWAGMFIKDEKALNEELNSLIYHYFKFKFDIEVFKETLTPYKNVYLKLLRISLEHFKSKGKITDEEIKNILEYKEEKDIDDIVAVSLDRERLKSTYELVISHNKREIDMLKEEIEELNSKQRESFNYSMNQYKFGIRDLFNLINSKNYGNIVDRFYCHVNGSKKLTEKELTMLVKNLIISLEAFGILPYSEENIGSSIEVEDKNIGTKYRVSDDVYKVNSREGEIVFPGWKYKDETLELPLVKIKWS